MGRVSEKWYSHRVGREVQVVRWGESGVPVVFSIRSRDRREWDKRDGPPGGARGGKKTK